MNGAVAGNTTAHTTSPPIRRRTITIGTSHHFFSSFRNCQNSPIRPLMGSPIDGPYHPPPRMRVPEFSSRTARVLALGALLASSAAADPGDWFKIQVVDDATGRGVPMVELRTVSQARFITDSAGVVAFGEPGLMD